MFPKKKRVINKKVLDRVRKLPCVVCGSKADDVDHIKTVGSGGNDSEDNLWPMCRSHHQQKHLLGLKRLCDKYPHLKEILFRKGFVFK